MESGIVERIRQLHADNEQRRHEIIQQQLLSASSIKNNRQQLLRDHFIEAKVKQISATASELLDLYDDGDFVDAQEEKITPEQAIKSLEAQVAHLRAYHREHPQPPFIQVLEEPSPDQKFVRFSGPERFGFCLDLQEHYSRYISFWNNSKEFAKVSTSSASEAAAKSSSSNQRLTLMQNLETPLTYSRYVRDLGKELSCPVKRKLFRLKQFREYAERLADYLADFFKRARPLQAEQVESNLKETVAAFEQQWENTSETIVGWETSVIRQDEVKDDAKAAALAEAKVELLVGVLEDVIEFTVESHERRQTKSVEEVERELEDEEERLREAFRQAASKLHAGAEGTDGAKPTTGTTAAMVDESRFTNPKNFPLDREGNPIPVWLYHLHGLHIKHHCEICNYVYYGEKAFTQHFNEVRHTAGLARLGITEGLELYQFVTSRATAVGLWKELHERRDKKRSRLEMTENEDELGNLTTTGMMMMGNPATTARRFA